MKFSTAFLLSALGMTSALSSSKMSISSRSSVSKVLSKARRVEEAAAEEEEEEDEFEFLQSYSLKIISCAAGEAVDVEGNGEYEYSAVTVRLCPSDSCDSDSQKGCSAGHGDYVVGLNTYVNAYLEEQKKQMENDGQEQADDEFEIERYAECREYEVEDDGDEDAGDDAVQYFIGPSCSDDGFDIKLSLFSDEECATPSDADFATISNGWDLPYSDGGLVSFNCINCIDYDENDGAGGTRELCQRSYENAAEKCETNMEYYSPVNGKIEDDCEHISELLPVMSSASNAGKIIGWIIFVLVVVGLVGYVMWWRKKKAANAAASSDGQMA